MKSYFYSTFILQKWNENRTNYVSHELLPKEIEKALFAIAHKNCCDVGKNTDKKSDKKSVIV